MFSTKYREPFLGKAIRRKIFEHIKQNASEKGIWLDSVNGYEEHAHCLISLGKEQSIAKVAQLIKGESFFWINNKQGWCNKQFMWQDDYLGCWGKQKPCAGCAKLYLPAGGASGKENFYGGNRSVYKEAWLGLCEGLKPLKEIFLKNPLQSALAD